MKSLYALHTEKWASGCGAEICSRAKNICYARGFIPCNILFIGEAPGQSENLHGIPFIGPAGHILNRIIERALRGIQDSNGHVITYGITNLVGCIPALDNAEVGSKKYGTPSGDDIECCKPRLEEFIQICNPSLIVCVGAVARDYLKQGYKHSVKVPKKEGSKEPIMIIDIIHPSALFKLPIATRGLMEQRSVVQIRNTVEDLIEAKVL